MSEVNKAPDVTNEDRHKLHEDAQIILHTADSRRTAVRLAEYIVANIPCPPKILADEIRGWDTAPRPRGALRVLADRVEAMQEEHADALSARDVATDQLRVACHQRDEARDEVEKLTEQVARQQQLMELHGVPRDTVIRPGSTTAPSATDPADVPGGEAWLVQVDGEEPAAGIRSISDQWRVYHSRGTYTAASHAVTLISRLVREVPRVITTANDLSALPEDTIVRDSADYAWQRVPARGWMVRGSSTPCSPHRLLKEFGPLTVLHVPEVKPDGDAAD